MKFYDDTHERLYATLCDKIGDKLDCYQRAVFYLFALDSVARQHINDLFDFDDNSIKLSALNKGWQTGTSKKTTRLAFNLWNNWYSDDVDSDDWQPSSTFTVSSIFECAEYAEFYFIAIQIRFERA